MIVATYIPLPSDAKLALKGLYWLISWQIYANPEVVVIMGGDFNYVELKLVLTFQPETIAFWNIPVAYKAVAAPHPAFSDYISVEQIAGLF